MRLAAAVCLGLAVLVQRGGRARLRLPARLDRLTRSSAGRRGRVRARARSRTRNATLLLAVFGAALAALVGPVAVAGTAVVLVVALLARRRNATRARSVAFDAGLCLDLMGAAMASGAAPAAALKAVARAVPGTAGDALAEAATALALGVSPVQAWSGVAAAVPQLARAAGACARAASSGAAVSEELFRQAAFARADGHVERRRRLQRAGVWLVLPLGLCFLPAFVLVAVVPVVVAALPALTG